MNEETTLVDRSTRWRRLAARFQTILRAGAALLLLVLVIGQAFALRVLQQRVGQMQQSIGGVIDEVGKKLTVAEQLELFGREMNEVRSFLYLPPKRYSFGAPGEAPEESGDPEGTELFRGLFLLLDTVAGDRERAAVLAAARLRLDALRQDPDLVAKLKGARLAFAPAILEEGEILALAVNEGRTSVRRLLYHGDTAEWELFASRGAVFFRTPEEFEAAIRAFAADAAGERARDAAHLALARQAESLLRERPVFEALVTRGLKADGRMLRNAEGASVAELRPSAAGDALLFIAGDDETRYATIEDARAALPAVIALLDGRTLTDRNVAARRVELEQALADPVFVALLAERGLTVSVEPRLEADRLYYPVTDASGAVLRQIVIERNAGARVLVVDAKGLHPVPLDGAAAAGGIPVSEAVPDVLPALARSAEDDLVVLVAGKHGSLVDTMILARIVPAERTITLLSIPRDLEVNNRKINAVWTQFGMGELKRQLSKLTGYDIDRSVLIDMYAFAEVVDLLGGVDVTLAERLIDPSYKTFDDGKWATLRYEPGVHHLNGRQALRLARSRHYSSDFKRAERQHLLLASLKEKVGALRAGDAGTLADMVRVALGRTDTDLTPPEALRYALRFNDFRVVHGAVMSTSNILVSKRANDDAFTAREASCAALPEGEERTACDDGLASFDHGAYILLPRNGNWQLPKWYAWKTFEGETRG